MFEGWESWKDRHIGIVQEVAERQTKIVEELNLSPIESIMHLELFRLIHFYGMHNFAICPQRKIGNYTVDFLIVLEVPNSKSIEVVIECDGHDFHEKTKQQVAKDKKRDRELQKLGYRVLRYSGSEIFNNPRQIHMDCSEILGMPDWMRDMRVKSYGS